MCSCRRSFVSLQGEKWALRTTWWAKTPRNNRQWYTGSATITVDSSSDNNTDEENNKSRRRSDRSGHHRWQSHDNINYEVLATGLNKAKHASLKKQQQRLPPPGDTWLCTKYYEVYIQSPVSRMQVKIRWIGRRFPKWEITHLPHRVRARKDRTESTLLSNIIIHDKPNAARTSIPQQQHESEQMTRLTHDPWTTIETSGHEAYSSSSKPDTNSTVRHYTNSK